MAQALDPYHRWLGIAPKHQPPNHYRLLGLEEFESDVEVITDAAERQMAHVRRYELGEHAELSQHILNELSRAKGELLDQKRKAAYDARLRVSRQPPTTITSSPTPPPVGPPSPQIPTLPYGSYTGATPQEHFPWANQIVPPRTAEPQSLMEGQWAPPPAHSGFEQPNYASQAKRRKKPWALSMAMHVGAPLLGLTVGYIILCYLGPQYDFLGLMSREPEQQQEVVETAVSSSSTPTKTQTIAPTPERVGDSFSNSVGMELALIRPGTFQMGPPPQEAGQTPAKAQVSVILTHAFYIGKTEVTQGQWRQVMGTSPWTGKEFVQENAACPATYVSWHDAQEFCKRLSAREGKTYRLPTEAEWEYACRAGTASSYHFGNTEGNLSQYAWFASNAWERGEQYPHLVAAKLPNALGLFDMHGNVWEWCLDHYSGRLPGGTNPLFLGEDAARITRGGSWDDSASYCRSASRFSDSPTYRDSDLGFRIVLQLAGAPGPTIVSKTDLPQLHASAPATTLPRPAAPLIGSGRRPTDSSPRPLALAGGPSPLDALRRESIDPHELAAAGGGDPAKAPAELVAILGTSRLKHWSDVYSVVFSPDGKTVVSGSGDKTIMLWDAETGELRRTLSGHTQGVSSVAFSPDGKTISSGSYDKTIKLWDAATGRERRTLSGHTGGVRCVAFSPDGKTIASGSYDKTIKLWDAGTGSERRMLTGHTGGVSSVAFSPDGGVLASSGLDGTVRLWNVADGQERAVWQLGPPGRRISQTAFDTTGRYLATANGNGMVYILRLANPAGQEQVSGSLQPPPAVASAQPIELAQPLIPADANRLGQVRTDNGLSCKLVWCPGGQFMMGSGPINEPSRENDEDQVSVTLTRGFWLGQTEVAQGQWKAVMGTEPWKGQRNMREGANYAASYLSWTDAMAFCKKLTESERRAVRLPADWEYTLPTEAQWEYACRVGTTTPYHFGTNDAALTQYGWYDKNADFANEKYAHEVGLKRANPWNLHDMHGNVWEWCRDWYADQLPGGTDPEATQTATYRVLRGGSWSRAAGGCRSARRGRLTPDYRYDDLGFRIALVPVLK